MLSLQDKLALALTSAGSQRALAKLVGVSHQKIGRWLREGQPATIDPTTGYMIHSAGAREIPFEYKSQINVAFELHKQVSRDQARADGLPFDRKYPTFDYRGMLRTGLQGERVITENTEFIRSDLRSEILRSKQVSQKYLQASVRSVINKRDYFERVADQEIRRTKRRFTTKEKLGAEIMRSFLARQKKIYADEDEMPLFTRYENISKGTNADRSVEAINKKLQAKHEAHATHLADQFLFQLMPTKQNAQRPKQKASSTRNRSRRT